MSYKLLAPWRVDRLFTVDGVDCTQWVCDLVDDRGYIFYEGAWKVKIGNRRAKTFKGETAWSDADRYLSDAVTAIRFGKDY